MAEHTLTIKAKLDDSEVRSKIDQLNQGGGAGGSSHSSKDIDKLSSSLNNLKRILGGGALVNSFMNLSESINLFGKEGDKTAQRLKSSANRVLASIASGNPIVIATTGLFETLAYQANKLNDQLEKSKKDFEELQKRIATFNDLRKAAEKRDQSRYDTKFLENASTSDIQRTLLGLQKERSNKIFERDYELEKGGTLGFDAEKVKKLNEEISELDATCDKYEATLKRRLEEHADEVSQEEERRSRFAQAISRFEASQEARAAIGRGDEGYFLRLREQALAGMASAKQSNLPDVWEEFRNQYESAQNALTQLWSKIEDDAKKQEQRATDLALAQADWADSEKTRFATMTGDISYFQ